MGWESAEALMEEPTPFGVFARSDIEPFQAQSVYRRQRTKNSQRDARIRQMRAEGYSIADLMEHFRISETTVYRVTRGG